MFYLLGNGGIGPCPAVDYPTAGILTASCVTRFSCQARTCWDGLASKPNDGWVVVTRGEVIETVGPANGVKVSEDARTIELPGTTLLPGLIDVHTHILLHPYNEALWDDQVLKEPLSLRVCRDEPFAKHTPLRFHNNP